MIVLKLGNHHEKSGNFRALLWGFTILIPVTFLWYRLLGEM